MPVLINTAGPDDAESILSLQKTAFHSEAALYNDFSVPPMTQTLENLRAEFSEKVFLKAMDSDRIIGSVRGFQRDEICFVERLIVHPDFQDQGIGTTLMYELV